MDMTKADLLKFFDEEVFDQAPDDALVNVYDVDTETECEITHRGVYLTDIGAKTIITFYINGSEEFVPGSEF